MVWITTIKRLTDITVRVYNKRKKEVELMEWDETFQLDILQSEMNRVASTNPKYLSFEREKQKLLRELKRNIRRSDYETVEKILDLMDLQAFLMIRSVLRVGNI